MKTIAICNQKGGVGKTTTAITLASYLALDGIRTLLVDLDPQGNTTSGVGIEKQKLERSIYHAISDPNQIPVCIKETTIPNLSILPSNIELTGAEIELVNEMGRELKVKKALNVVQSDFEFCIIDCPPSLGLLTINALTAADSIIIPIQCEFYALEGLGQLIKTIELVRDNLNLSLQIEGILMTMGDNRTNLTDQVVNEVKSHFSHKIYNTIIPRSIKVAEAPSFGKPIMLYDKNCIACKKYDEFHKEFLDLNRNLLKLNELKEISHGA